MHEYLSKISYTPQLLPFFLISGRGMGGWRGGEKYQTRWKSLSEFVKMLFSLHSKHFRVEVNFQKDLPDQDG